MFFQFHHWNMSCYKSIKKLSGFKSQTNRRGREKIHPFVSPHQKKEIKRKSCFLLALGCLFNLGLSMELPATTFHPQLTPQSCANKACAVTSPLSQSAEIHLPKHWKKRQGVLIFNPGFSNSSHTLLHTFLIGGVLPCYQVISNLWCFWGTS